MEDLNLLIARNLKKIRDEKKLSLEKLAVLTGVSKSMLGQIERGDSSPTISTVWKISNGLKVSFTSLLDSVQTDPTVIRQANITPLVEDRGKYRLYPLFPIEPGRRFEIYSIEIDQGGYLSAEAHPDGAEEFLTIFTGAITVMVNAQEYRASAGDSIRFRADQPHAYLNPGEMVAKISLIIHYI
ncbi:MAG: XRE family transcriptional regulator [Anaerolineaceae bacterium]|nr:XRE family transcriptional regulator [Anaerolineaceae bacterium]